MLHLSELDDIRNEVYENVRIYKDKKKLGMTNIS